MSDTSQGRGWWQASDGKWYPPADSEQPAPGWWLASDGNWYPPEQAPTGDPAVRTPVKPVAKPVKPVVKPVKPVAKPVEPVAKPRTAPPTAAMGTPAGPAVAPTTAGHAGSGTKRPAAAEPAPSVGATQPTKAAEPVKPVTTTLATSPAEPARSAEPVKPAKAVKPAAASPKGPDAAPAAAPSGVKPPPGEPRPTLSGGLSPDQQIRVRNEQSRRDAAVLFGARKDAATRALGNISALIEQEKAAPPRELRETGASRAAASAPTTPEPPTVPAGRTTPATPKSKGKMGRVIKAGLSGTDAESPAVPPARADEQPVVVDGPEPAAPSEPPLLEVKQGTLAADIEHIGERLVIFNDRVELHDRADRVRQVIAGADIADVVVHKKFTGSTVTVESGTGESIVAKGLKPEQADEIRSVILKRTRAGVPSGASATAERAARPTPVGAVVDARDPKPASSLSRTEGAELFAKVDDLHRAGVLTDDERAEKRALIESMVEGAPLAVSTPSA